MARAGLGSGWRCDFANDFDLMKTKAYAANWGADHLLHADVATVKTSDLPGVADLAWASFPCQDLSLAGDYAGLGRAASAVMTRSGTFWPFWALIERLSRERRSPRIIVLENVIGVLTSNSGRDFAAIASALSKTGYLFGALVANASLFVPQSRPRVFFIAVRKNENIPRNLTESFPQGPWYPPALIKAHSNLSKDAHRNWVWWNLATPQARKVVFADLIEESPTDVTWHSPAETKKLLDMMSTVNKAKVSAAKKLKTRVVGGVYKRTRLDPDGMKRQRAEVRFDNVAGCLRTPAGGSSRQTILIVESESVRSRLLSPREAARLMGLDDSYVLPARYNDAYHVAGDGVCVPVVRYLAENILEPIIENNPPVAMMAAE